MKFATVLMLVGLCAALFLAACSAPAPEESAPVSVANEPIPTPATVMGATPSRHVLYYFHRTLRCEECLSMEFFAGALVRARFEDALLDETLQYVVINLDDAGNEHYAEQFNLTFSTLVLVAEDTSGDIIEWQELDEAWETSLDEEMFTKYVAGEITAWLARWQQ